jgi:hypothetical protein
MSGSVRLADLISANKPLWVYCTACGHERDLDPLSLPLPGDMPVPDVRRSMRCTICG